MVSGAYYNENDSFAAAWLRELMKAGLIADGEVDERSIADVAADDVRGFVQCHFFAGIGGWSYALRLAGWPDDRAVWTGSCPCQPWSSAGAGLGTADSRDLWPTWFQLVRESRPGVVFGEQVAGKAGRVWIDRLYADMEGIGYAVGAVDLPAASVHAPHNRARHWFVADADVRRWRWGQAAEGWAAWTDASGGCLRLVLAHTDGTFSGQGRPLQRSWSELQPDRDPALGAPWQGAAWIECRDGKRRPIEPGLEPLAHGLPARLGRLRGYGNAIVPQVAAAFIEAYMTVGEGKSADARILRVEGSQA
jgi:DNA (cytosine-5)-methyltransferase 1